MSGGRSSVTGKSELQWVPCGPPSAFWAPAQARSKGDGALGSQGQREVLVASPGTAPLPQGLTQSIRGILSGQKIDAGLQDPGSESRDQGRRPEASSPVGDWNKVEKGSCLR